MSFEWIEPNLRDSAFAHFVHLLLMGGVVVCGWKAISAFTRKPSRVFDGVRYVVYAAWLAVLFLILTKLNPMPYLQPAAVIAVTLLGFKLWERFVAPGERKDLQKI